MRLHVVWRVLHLQNTLVSLKSQRQLGTPVRNLNFTKNEHGTLK